MYFNSITRYLVHDSLKGLLHSTFEDQIWIVLSWLNILLLNYSQQFPIRYKRDISPMNKWRVEWKFHADSLGGKRDVRFTRNPSLD